MRKEKEKKILPTLKFMLKTAVKNKPQLFIAYALQVVVSFSQTMVNIISSKYLVDEIAAIIGGGKAEEHIPTAIFCIALIVGVTLLAALINYLVNEIKNVYSEWFNEYFEVSLSEKVMKMDFEHTEDPDTLDQMNKAKEGMSWYSGGVVGILNGFFNIVSNGVNVLGVIAIIAVTCPLLLPIQIISLVLITIFTNKSNKLDIEYFRSCLKSIAFSGISSISCPTRQTARR